MANSSVSKNTTSRKTAKAKPDLRPMRSMGLAEIEAAARSDPDAKPFSAAQLAGMKHTPRAKLIRRALGLTQVPLMAMRLARPRLLVDIARIPDLAFVRAGGNAIAIGATTRQCVVERDPI